MNSPIGQRPSSRSKPSPDKSDSSDSSDSSDFSPIPSLFPLQVKKIPSGYFSPTVFFVILQQNQ